MSDKSRWQPLAWLRYWVAVRAMRFCGPERLYWAAAVEWEDYMSHGEPLPAWTPVPPSIFQDIEFLCEESDGNRGPVERVMDWLYSQQVTIEDGQP